MWHGVWRVLLHFRAGQPRSELLSIGGQPGKSLRLPGRLQLRHGPPGGYSACGRRLRCPCCRSSGVSSSACRRLRCAARHRAGRDPCSCSRPALLGNFFHCSFPPRSPCRLTFFARLTTGTVSARLLSPTLCLPDTRSTGNVRRSLCVFSFVSLSAFFCA